jgi:hypothetical protein
MCKASVETKNQGCMNKILHASAFMKLLQNKIRS